MVLSYANKQTMELLEGSFYFAPTTLCGNTRILVMQFNQLCFTSKCLDAKFTSVFLYSPPVYSLTLSTPFWYFLRYYNMSWAKVETEENLEINP